MLVITAWLDSMRGSDVHLPRHKWTRRDVIQATSIPVANPRALAITARRHDVRLRQPRPLVRSNPGVTLLLLKPFTSHTLISAIRDAVPAL